MKIYFENLLNEQSYHDLDHNDFPYESQFEAIMKLKYSRADIDNDVLNAIHGLRDAVKNTFSIVSEKVLKPEREAKAAAEKARKESTGLIVNLTQAQADLISAVLGQLSDGYWENNNYYDFVWKNCSIDGTKLIIDLEKMRYAKFGDRFRNDFSLLSNERTAKQWFAKKAQIVQNADLKYQFNTTKLKGHEDDEAMFLDRDVNKTLGQVQAAIDSLK